MEDAVAESASGAVEEGLSGVAEEPSVAVKSDFSQVLAFLPDLRPENDSVLRLSFKASDKISTFIVSALAHDKELNGAVVRKEMLVSRVVMVAMNEPQYLCRAD